MCALWQMDERKSKVEEERKIRVFGGNRED